MTFNAESYDPYAGWDDDREVHQRINAVHHDNEITGKSTQPKIADFTLINQIAKGMDTVAFGQLSPLDRNKDTHDLALQIIDDYRTYVVHHNGTIYADHLGVQLDPELSQQTANRCYGILASNPQGLHPLSKDWTWEQVSHKYLSRAKKCDLQVVYGCDEDDPPLRFAVKAGEFIAIIASCQKCRDWFDDDPLTRYRLQQGDFGDLWSKRPWRVRDDRND